MNTKIIDCPRCLGKGFVNKEDIKRLYSKIDENGKRYTTIPIHAPGETKNGESSKKWKGMNYNFSKGYHLLFYYRV